MSSAEAADALNNCSAHMITEKQDQHEAEKDDFAFHIPVSPANWVPVPDLVIIACFRLGGRDVADGLQQTLVIEPVHPFQRGELDRLARAPWPARVDHLGLKEPDHRLGERVRSWRRFPRPSHQLDAVGPIASA